MRVSHFHADKQTDKMSSYVTFRNCFEEVPKGGFDNRCRTRTWQDEYFTANYCNQTESGIIRLEKLTVT
jgi:hypothetical protein